MCSLIIFPQIFIVCWCRVKDQWYTPTLQLQETQEAKTFGISVEPLMGWWTIYIKSHANCSNLQRPCGANVYHGSTPVAVLFYCLTTKRRHIHRWYCYHILLHIPETQWRHNEPNGVSNHRRLHYLLNRLFRHRSKQTSKLRVIGLCEGNSPMTGQSASNAEKDSIWWRHHENKIR